MGYVRHGEDHYIVEPLPNEILVGSLPQELLRNITQQNNINSYPAASESTHNYTKYSNYSRKIHRKLTELHNKYPYHHQSSRPARDVNQNKEETALIMHHVMYKYKPTPNSSLTSMHAERVAAEGLRRRSDNSCVQGEYSLFLTIFDAKKAELLEYLLNQENIVEIMHDNGWERFHWNKYARFT